MYNELRNKETALSRQEDMKMTLRKNTKLFSEALHRWLWFTGEVTRNEKYIFVDVADERFALTIEEVERLKVRI